MAGGKAAHGEAAQRYGVVECPDDAVAAAIEPALVIVAHPGPQVVLVQGVLRSCRCSLRPIAKTGAAMHTLGFCTCAWRPPHLLADGATHTTP